MIANSSVECFYIFQLSVSKPDKDSAVKYQMQSEKLCVQHIVVPCGESDLLISSFDILTFNVKDGKKENDSLVSL